MSAGRDYRFKKAGPMTKRYWIRFFGGENGDPRPVTSPPPFEWWCTGESGHGTCTICALVDATDDMAAREEVLKYWPEARHDEVHNRPCEWRPPADRFPPKSAERAGPNE